jgi:stage II sporulation protein D
VVRVLIGHEGRGKISATGPYLIETYPGGTELERGRDLTPADFTGTRSGLRLGAKTYDTAAVRVRPLADGVLRYRNRPYRGSFVIMRRIDGDVALVNRVAMEQYLRGVVASEMPVSFEAAALEAQAVASRTYALEALKVGEGASAPGFDLRDDQRSQVYKGIEGEAAKAIEAVEKTRGLVLAYDGDVFPAYFSSSCGGRTVPATDVWEDAPGIPPLRGTDCGACGISHHVPWRAPVTLTAAEITTALREAGRVTRRVTDVVPLETGPGGHISKIEVRTAGGGSTTMSGNDFRMAVGSMKLKSTSFSVSRRGGRFTFDGTGFGHGAGMCQWGAQGMARRGVSGSEILLHYYPGASLVKVYP